MWRACADFTCTALPFIIFKLNQLFVNLFGTKLQNNPRNKQNSSTSLGLNVFPPNKQIKELLLASYAKES